MAPAPADLAARFRRRASLALGLFVVLTAAATLLAALQSDVQTTDAPAAAPSIGHQRSAGPPAQDGDAGQRRALLADVGSWRDARGASDQAAIASDTSDLIAIDPALIDGRPASEQAVALRALQRKPDGGQRLVLGHLSIGAAEPNRPYWRAKSAAEAVLPITGGVRTADATDPVPVRYWEPGWQALLHGRPGALLDRLIAAGYDGVYLAGGDVSRLARPGNPDAEAQMADLVARLAHYARALNPQFIVMLGGAEDLLTQTTVRTAIDAIAKPDLLFGINGPALPNDEADIASSLLALQSATRSGHRVFVSERAAAGELAETAARRLNELNFVADISAATGGDRSGRVWSRVKF